MKLLRIVGKSNIFQDFHIASYFQVGFHDLKENKQVIPNTYLWNILHQSKLHKRSLHLSCSTFKKVKTEQILKEIDPEGKLRKGLPINFNRKKDKSKVRNVWVGITGEELSVQLGRSEDDVLEAMTYVQHAEQYMKFDNAIIDSIVLLNIVKKLGLNVHFIANPNKPKKQEVNLDVKRRPPADPKDLVKRPPVITIMGHVDHGKTTLLDALRNTAVVEQEFGGITQHIGAFSVPLFTGENITFLDTPGHAAFSAMRARGAYVTDIVVLVVAADDGVMEQTIESIKYANEANVPILVAINKCDKSQINIERTKKELMEHGVVLEDFGGEVQSVCISALKNEGLKELQEAIITQAEIMDLKAERKGLVEGVVVESQTDMYRGKLSTALIQRGTLKKGSFLVAGSAWARVRAMFNDKGHPIQEALPSCPVEIVGWKELPSAGDEILEVESEGQARTVMKYREALKMEEKIDKDAEVIKKKTEEHLKIYRAELEKRRLLGRRRKIHTNRTKEYTEKEGPQMAIILKGDVDGSVEAILDVLSSYNSKKCNLDVIHYGVGSITVNDIELADPFQGIVYGFNVNVNSDALKLAQSKHVTIKLFNVIYKLIHDLKNEIDKKLPLVTEETVIGQAHVLAEFLVTMSNNKKVPVAGCRCEKGELQKKAKFKIMRESEILASEAKVESLRHFKDEVNTVSKNMECGICFDNSDIRFQFGDEIICYIDKQISQTIDWNPPGF